MSATKKLISLFSLISGLIFLVEPLDAKMFDMYDRSGDLTTTGLIMYSAVGAAIAALSYDIYTTYYIPKKDREATFTDNLLLVAEDHRQYLQSPDAIEDAFNILYNVGYGALVTGVSAMVWKMIDEEEVKVELFNAGDIKTKFSDVAGLDEAKEGMKDIVEYLKHPEKYKAIGAPAPKGVLMYGGPGNGKTLLARAVAGEVNCSFISMAGSSFVEMYVGLGAQRVRDLFALARRQGPCIIFIDEIDALITKRNSSDTEQNQTVAAFLAEVDGLQDNKYPIIVIGATNRLDAIDRPAIRPGRFDRHIEITKPKTEDRVQLLGMNLAKVKHETSVDIAKIADMTSGFSGAELTNLVNQSALLAVQQDCKVVEMHHLTQAFDTIKESMMTTIDASFNLDIAYPGDITTTFKDIAGLSHAKYEAQALIDYLKNPSSYNNRGINPPKGILLDGPPGNGKTSLARAIAGEANCPFISISGSGFVEKYVGTGAARVRELFEKARKQAPCIIFIDEIDALLSKRSDSDGSGGQDERNSTIAEFLSQVDGLKNNKKPVILIGATNRRQALDESAIRPGRFDQKIHISNPSQQDRLEMLQIKMKDIKVESDIDLPFIAEMTEGLSGADIAHLINEANRLAMKYGAQSISMNILEQATEKVKNGEEFFVYQLSNEDKKIIAYRKAGRALGIISENKDVVNKVSITPRSNSLGLVSSSSLQESIMHQSAKKRAEIRMLFCEHLAEQKISKQEDAGQSNDLQQAHAMALDMIHMHGIPDKLAQVGNKLKRKEDVAAEIVEEEYKKAQIIINNNKKDLEKIVPVLLEKETLSGQELYDLLGKKKPVKKDDEENIFNKK
ncbi:AAA family ATPase [Candidatus Chromulinivorax destructor]|uniref:AAA+ ATPase domain-containing protein n=1 Tax=Candidatus Chromulinivorax destructor TaxID=2066483 RepID=A0A345ZC83_9BACT|nr:AAA family ATPase [Candidatus Chromulinivorax destructor]AXK60900.1 hypothetical protein C0J27_04100 [Candidatus Chromulinivorax destructor]